MPLLVPLYRRGAGDLGSEVVFLGHTVNNCPSPDLKPGLFWLQSQSSVPFQREETLLPPISWQVRPCE